MKTNAKFLVPLAAVALAILLFALAERRPAYFTDTGLLGGLLLLQALIVTVWHYERWFFAVMMLTFVWAGTDLALAGIGTQGRWVFLGVGAFVGVIKWAQRDHRQPFRAIHMVALLCVLSAAVSSMVSRRMELSVLKSGSFFLLFLYTSFGARVSLVGRERAFFSGLTLACEVIAFLSAAFYWGLHFEIFGNPNSLGAVMGVVLVPILLWAVLSTQETHLRHRRTLALLLAVGLLASSLSRAGMLACAVTVTVMCIAVRRHSLLIKTAFALFFLVAVTAIVRPQKFDALVNSFTEDVVYKGKRDHGILGSRESPWQETVDVIRENPWFGTGFGTDVTEGQLPPGISTASRGLAFSTRAGQAREHGNSYLAILDFVGLLGVIPFLLLIGLVLREIFRGCALMRRTCDVSSYVVPLLLVAIAGLIHAFFEDWLFAVGFHLNVFFWTAVFLLAELQPGRLADPVSLRHPRGATAMCGYPVSLPSAR